MPPFAINAFAAILFGLMLASAALWVRTIRRFRAGELAIVRDPHAVVSWAGWDVLFLVCVALALETAAMHGAVRDGELRENLTAGDVAAQGAAHVVWLAFAVAFLWGKTGAAFGEMGFDRTKLADDVRFAGKVFLAVLLPVYGVQFILMQFIPSQHPLVKLAIEDPTARVLLVASVSAIVVAPVFEEFLFRVVLQSWFERAEIVWREQTSDPGPLPLGLVPNVTVATIFGLMHWGHGPDPAALFVLSLILGYAYQQTGRIVPGLVVHVLFNTLAVIELWITVLD